MKNVYYIHLFGLYPADSGLDQTRWLCRDCANKRHVRARIQMQYVVNGSEVCEDCGAKQISFQIGTFVERKSTPRGTRTVAGRIAGVEWSGKLQVDWIAPHRIGGDGWHRSVISFKAVKIANPDRTAAAQRWAANH